MKKSSVDSLHATATPRPLPACVPSNTLLYFGADIDVQMLRYLGVNETHAIYIDPLVSFTDGLDKYADFHATDPRQYYRYNSKMLRPFTADKMPQMHKLLVGRLANEIGLHASPEVVTNLTIRFDLLGKERTLRYAVTDVWRLVCDASQRLVLNAAIGKVSTFCMVGIAFKPVLMRWLARSLRISLCSQRIRVICSAEDRDHYRRAFGQLLEASPVPDYRTGDTLSNPGNNCSGTDCEIWSYVFSTANLGSYEDTHKARSCEQMIDAKLEGDEHRPRMLGQSDAPFKPVRPAADSSSLLSLSLPSLTGVNQGQVEMEVDRRGNPSFLLSHRFILPAVVLATTAAILILRTLIERFPLRLGGSDIVQAPRRTSGRARRSMPMKP